MLITVIVECTDGTYGEGCLQPCQCLPGTTSYCNKTDGNCVCNEGWTSANCSVDVDECKDSHVQCTAHSVCRNLDGSYQCICDLGFYFNTATKLCEGKKRFYSM